MAPEPTSQPEPEPASTADPRPEPQQETTSDNPSLEQIVTETAHQTSPSPDSTPSPAIFALTSSTPPGSLFSTNAMSTSTPLFAALSSDLSAIPSALASSSSVVVAALEVDGPRALPGGAVAAVVLASLLGSMLLLALAIWTVKKWIAGPARLRIGEGVGEEKGLVSSAPTHPGRIQSP